MGAYKKHLHKWGKILQTAIVNKNKMVLLEKMYNDREYMHHMASHEILPSM